MDLKVKQRGDEIVARFKNVTKEFVKKEDPILNVKTPVFPDDYKSLEKWSDDDRLALKYKHLKLLIVDHHDIYKLLCVDWETNDTTISKMINRWFNCLSGVQRTEIVNKAFDDLEPKTDLQQKFFARFDMEHNYVLLNNVGDVVYENVFLYDGQHYLSSNVIINTFHLTPKQITTW